MWNILIADDSDTDRNVILNGLKDHANCKSAENGKDALAQWSEARSAGNAFDFVLLDVTMPEQDGFDVLKAIREIEEQEKNDELAQTRVIMITTFKDSLMENYNIGWDEFITKPVDPDILLNHLQSFS